MASRSAAELPGYRRRFRVEAGQGSVVAMMEDDMHCMAVALHHDGAIVTAVEPVVDRAPWTTCPGARDKLVETFAGQPLAEVTARREKKLNCTHLHDLAVLAAVHAGDREVLAYEIFVADPVAGERLLEIRRNGETLHRWAEQDGTLAAPEVVAGRTLFALRDWINELEEPEREAARMLQWASLVAHGRTMPMERQSVATAIPPNCYTFQPERAVHARRIGAMVDFNGDKPAPLAESGDRMTGALTRD